MEELKKEMAKRWLKLANYLSDEKLDGKTIFTLSFQDGCNFIIHPEGKNGSTLDLSICIHLQPVEQEKQQLPWKTDALSYAKQFEKEKPSESAEEKTLEEIFEENGFDFVAFELENEYSAKNLLKSIKEYANQKPEIPSDEEMNQKAIKYGELKSQHRFGITDYERSEAEIDFLRGYNAAVNDWRERIKK